MLRPPLSVAIVILALLFRVGIFGVLRRPRDAIGSLKASVNIEAANKAEEAQPSPAFLLAIFPSSPFPRTFSN